MICEARDDVTSKTVEIRLLSVNDLVAVEAPYHIYPVEQNFKIRPVLLSKTALYKKACEVMENDVSLYTVSEFHALIYKSGDDVYTPRMVKMKLKQKHK